MPDHPGRFLAVLVYMFYYYSIFFLTLSTISPRRRGLSVPNPVPFTGSLTTRHD